MLADDSMMDPTPRFDGAMSSARARRPALPLRGGPRGRSDLRARIHRHNAATSPLLAGALCLGAWAAAWLIDARLGAGAGIWAWSAAVTLLALGYAVFSRRPLEEEERSRAVIPTLVLAAAGVLGLGLAAAPPSQGEPEGPLLALIALGVAAAAVPVLALRPRLLLATLAACTLPLVVAGAAQGGSERLLAGVLLVAALALAVGAARLGTAFRKTLRNDVEQRALLRRLEQTNQALSADRVVLQTESRTDPLTGLANRRQLEETLHSEWSRARRSGLPLSCVLVDIDHFKLYNDHYGHDGGDVCLRRVAAVLSGSTRRASDVVARYGGEEFVVLLPETGNDGATTVADLIKRGVADTGIPHARSPVGPVVTVSIGVATLVPRADRVPGELLKAADLALYEAKGGGRNRVVMADDDTLDSARMAARGLIG